MSTIALDTLKTVQKLKAQGFSDAQAEGIVSTITESELLTKSDLREAQADLTAKMYIAMLVQTGAIVAILAAVQGMLG